MTRILSILLAGVLIFAGIWNYVAGVTIRDLREREAVQQFAARMSDERNAVLMAQLATDSVVRDSLERFNATLRHDLQRVRTRTVRLIQMRDSALATIDVDTLSPGVRNLLSLVRGVAESNRVGWDLERELRKMAEVQVAQLLKRQRALRILLLDVTAQRDSALVLAGDAIALASPSFFSKLFQDLPRKAACGVGGAIVAELNNGKALTGAAVALGVCLAAGAIF